jgi:hypothetical protein
MKQIAWFSKKIFCLLRHNELAGTATTSQKFLITLVAEG